MSQEILMNCTPQETRVAVVENGVLQEVSVERARRRGLVGNIYKGWVQRVLPGMQAAFIEVGLERTAFLHASDVAVASDSEAGETRLRGPVPDIQALLHDGQEIIVQVIKDPMGSKGARLTTHLTIPSRYLVMLPRSRNLGVSARIEDAAERERLRTIGQRFLEEGDPGGYIIRTAAERASEAALEADRRFLCKLWEDVAARAQEASAGVCVHEDLPLVLRSLRDIMSTEVERIRVDSRENFHKVHAFCEQFFPEMTARVQAYSGERPLFDFYGVEEEIQRALSRKVELKSGGYLMIDQTEALTTIDVNTGAYVGRRNLEETIFKTNLEAAQGIARQVRLRNLGGIIIIDFIDMQDPEHKRQVLRALERCLEKDYAKTQISGVSALGLVEMTRKRTRESLEHVLCAACPTCQGRGFVKTPETVCYEIFRELMREARQFEADQMLVVAARSVVDLMVEDESMSVAELEEFIGRPITFQAEPLYAQDQFDVVLM
ncbi:ribonuclease G [Aquisalimonas sp.]|uniref:ribonuclease G n=1 Tax=Aquisalimonas sp. TaxID=1872621 RepID=UPI0025B8FB7D|nr:ribonuclease G [Aquisalimonas sp.]